ncbi:MAG TPA: L,D-transpeptidase family protein [Ilumatobacteraceae bacterium]|nr:L,D-transpeptidase family protein [Ilumatobacteraceae bacterium]
MTTLIDAESAPSAPDVELPEHEPIDHRRRTALAIAIAAVLGVATLGAVLTGQSDSSLTLTGGDAAGAPVAAAPVVTASSPVIAAAAAIPDLEGDLGQNEVEPTAPVESDRADGGCSIGALSVRLSSEGPGVACLQQALVDLGYYEGAVDGDFDDPTLAAVMQFQADQNLFVDGVVGRESAIELDIWPDEESLVVRTPAPPDGAMDSTGYLLSPVASVGDNAPPLPADSGSGRRVVYDRAGQRVWAVDDNEQIIRSWLVSGSKFSNEEPGTHTVYSRSDKSTAWNGKAWLPLMIRYQVTDIGHIGFHAIPLHVSDNTPYQTTDELGTRLSGGCQRQHNLDAAFLWAFADVGTTVVVT